MKRWQLLLAIMVILVFVIIISTTLLYLTLLTPIDGNITDNQTQIITVKNGDIIPDDVCIQRGIKNKVIMIYKQGCPACSIAIPRLEEVERDLDLKFEYLDLSESEDVQRLLEIGIISQYVPTLLADCKVYVGVLPKEDYKNIVQGIS
ncbi:hypothetical protein KY342_01555 [Candidatus Woesearchaeota archaeon]|nr:hypothetical protein [Candidatus Woesearchaeota archaeon]